MDSDDRDKAGLPPDPGVVAAREAAPSPGRLEPMPPRTQGRDEDRPRSGSPDAPPRPGGGADLNDHDDLEPAVDRDFQAQPGAPARR